MVWGTFFGDEVPQSARLSAGGCKSYSGNAQMPARKFEEGFPNRNTNDLPDVVTASVPYLKLLSREGARMKPLLWSMILKFSNRHQTLQQLGTLTKTKRNQKSKKMNCH